MYSKVVFQTSMGVNIHGKEYLHVEKGEMSACKIL